MPTLPKNKNVDWIFFDIGDTLVNEDKLRFNLYRILEKNLHDNNIDLSFQDIIATREDLILGHADESPHYTIAKMYLPEGLYHQWHHDIKNHIHRNLKRDLILIPGMERILKKLSRSYSLGLIADQPHEILDFLKAKGVLNYFKIYAISALLGINKPKKTLYEWAINHAGCSFENALMIGDRIDRDIIPAKEFDMFTIQVKWNTYRKGFEPSTKKQLMYLESLHRLKNWQTEPASKKEEPDATVERVSLLPAAIEALS
ncbi:HAD family hydrolase [bacterium]|nr:MAG: HAD family hydrolase [bacterium]